MASSSSVSESTKQELAQGTSIQQETPAYEIKGRTMSLEEWELTVQVESPVDFTSLAYHGCNIKEFYGSGPLTLLWYAKWSNLCESHKALLGKSICLW